MNKRNLFKQMAEFFFGLREKIILFKQKHPERIIAGMFLILLVALAIFLVTKFTHKQSYKASATTLINRFHAPAATSPGTIPTDVMSLVSLYAKTKTINPDSLTLKDSLLLKEINKDLNKILK